MVSFIGPIGTPVPAEIQTPAPNGARLGLSALIGSVSQRIGRSGRRLEANQPAYVMLSCYDQFSTSPLVPRDSVTGFALISLRR